MPHKKVTQMESETDAAEVEKDPDVSDAKKRGRGRPSKGMKGDGQDDKEKKSVGKPKINKTKKIRKASSKKYRKHIVHSDPQRVQDCFPLAITYMSEPKEASMDKIHQYLVKQYEGIEKDELKDTLAAGIEKKYWEKSESGDYRLLIGDLDGCKGKNYFREVINAIIASNTVKICTFMLLKKYISDYHEEFGINVHPDKLRRALYRADEKGIIRFVKGVGLAAQYELCDPFIPSPAILAGKDKASDYDNTTDVSTEQSSEDETESLVEGRNVRGAAMRATAKLSKSIHADDDAEEFKNYYEDSETDVSSDNSSIAEWKLNDPRYYQDAYVPRGTAIKQYSRQASEHSVNRLDPSVVRVRRKISKGRGRPSKGKGKKKTKKRKSKFYDSDSEEDISDISDVAEDDFKDKYVPTPSKSRGGGRGRRKADDSEDEGKGKKKGQKRGRKPKKTEANLSEEEESEEEDTKKSPKKNNKKDEGGKGKRQSKKSSRKRTNKGEETDESEEEKEVTPVKKSSKKRTNKGEETDESEEETPVKKSSRKRTKKGEETDESEEETPVKKSSRKRTKKGDETDESEEETPVKKSSRKRTNKGEESDESEEVTRGKKSSRKRANKGEETDESEEEKEVTPVKKSSKKRANKGEETDESEEEKEVTPVKKSKKGEDDGGTKEAKNTGRTKKKGKKSR